ncbi:hypothetical protein NDU88_007877 [Pleurodeles waltl]|uniref:Uncharacterized protein n=1 Tax=Pleurodeles waltl TaxID=8319 RepID=A0AAV7QP86_PLEWA|nr:hypothetical protein NDU88_007877 [Pleurodeles waltl]
MTQSPWLMSTRGLLTWAPPCLQTGKSQWVFCDHEPQWESAGINAAGATPRCTAGQRHEGRDYGRKGMIRQQPPRLPRRGLHQDHASAGESYGNPDIRVPEAIDRKDGQSARRALEEDAVAAGSPDIRVPENLKSENGLFAGRAEKEEDAEGITAESAEKKASGEDQRTTNPYLGEEEPQNARDYPTEGQDGPKKLELRHVPGGMWLNQLTAWLSAFHKGIAPYGLIQTHEVSRKTALLLTLASGKRATEMKAFTINQPLSRYMRTQ